MSVTPPPLKNVNISAIQSYAISNDLDKHSLLISRRGTTNGQFRNLKLERGKFRKMALPSTLLSLLLSLNVVSAMLLSDDRTTRRPWKGEPEEGRKTLLRTRNRQQRSETLKTLKALDFSDDSDHEKDGNGEFTKATLNAGALPESFTICAAYTADNWTTFASIRFSSIKLSLLTDAGKTWGYVNLFSAETYTQYLF